MASYTKTPEELKKFRQVDCLYSNVDALYVVWEADPQVFRKVLPADLSMEEPLVYAFFSNYRKSGFGLPPYRIGSLSLKCSYGDVKGSYTISMLIDGSDMGIVLGHDIYGYPKKCGSALLSVDGNELRANAERHGANLCTVKGVFDDCPDEKILQIMPQPPLHTPQTSYNFHYHYDVSCPGTDAHPFDIWKFRNVELTHGAAVNVFDSSRYVKIEEFNMEPSEDDPWYELRPVRVIGGVYREYQFRLMGNYVDKTYTDDELAAVEPFLFHRYDASQFKP